MRTAALLVLFASLALADRRAPAVTYGCSYASGTYTLHPGASYDASFAAWGKFYDTLFETGWGSLHVFTSTASASDEQALYCAGMVEGALTHARIATHLTIYKRSTISDMGGKDGEWPSGLVKFIQANIDYTRGKAQERKVADEWWRHVAYVLAHTDGMREGYNRKRAEGEPEATEIDWWVLQSSGDMDDLQGFIKPDGTLSPTHAKMSSEWHDTHHHCTGSVFLAPGYKDLWFAQDAWQSYNVMNRIMKDYDFALRDQGASRRWTFASHPGLGFSMDDFWQLDSGLLVLETTLHTWNTTLYDLYCKPETVFCWIRVQVANRLGYDGAHWVQNFVRENSGTYNNQYFVVDLNKFTPGQRPKKDLLWAVEQLPGDYEAGDRTDELAENLYVPSINTPAFKRLYEKSGYPQKIVESGNDYWSYENCSRMKIFKRDAPGVTTYEEFQTFMRQNHYQTDPACSGDPAQSILSRYDLRPDECIQSGTMRMCPNAFGGTDAKTTRYDMAKELRFDVINSPNYESQPVWEFGSARFANVPYDGLPKRWKFPWATFATEQP